MTKPFSEWTVLPHGDLTKIDDNLLTVTGLLRMPPMGDVQRMDAKAWKARYPQMKVVAPSGACAKVASIIPVDDTSIDFADPSVRFITVPGTAERESALLVEGTSGTTLVINDLIFNLSNRHGLRGWLGKVFGMTGDEPHMPRIIRMRRVADRDALKAQLERWASMPKLQRILVSHGKVIAENPSRVLGKIAQDLAA